MKKILLLALFLISTLFGQFDNSVNGWVKGAFYVPDGVVYSEGVTVVDEGTLAGESLSEVNFASHANWDVTNDFDDTGGNAAFIWSANQTSTLTQIQANLATAGVDAVWYLFTYTVTVITAFDGDGAATITTGFAASAVSLDLSAGTHSVYFKSKTTPVDFVISIVSGSDTEGTFEIDDVTLKEIQGGNVDISGSLLIRGVNISTEVSGKMSNVIEDVTPQLGANLDIQAFNITGSGLWQAGTVAFGKGGTGLTAWTQYLLPYAATTTSFGQIAIGSNGDVLTSGGAGVAPSFQAAAGGGDFSDGGEVGGAARTLGNTDGYNMGFETNNVERAYFNATTGHFYPVGNGTYDLGGSSNHWNNFYANIGYIPTFYANGMYHTNDADTKFVFDSADEAQIYAGGVKFMAFIEGGLDYISIGESADINISTHAYGYDYGLNLWTWGSNKAILYGANAHEQHSLKVVTYNGTETEFYSDRGNIQTMTFGAGNITLFDFNVPGDNNAMEFTLKMIQDATGGRTVTTWDASIIWISGVAPTLWTGANAVDILRFFYDGTNWYGWEIKGSSTQYAEMYLNANGNPTTIETASTPIAVRNFTTGTLNGWTYVAGSTGAITAFYDRGANVGVHDDTHGLSTDDIISIRGTTNYNGIFSVTVVDADSFYVADTWVDDDGVSDWDEGDYLLAGTDAAGVYMIDYNISTSEGGGAGSTVDYCMYLNTTLQAKTIVQRKFANNDVGAVGGGGEATVSVGDRLIFVQQSSGTNALTNSYGNVRIQKL